MRRPLLVLAAAALAMQPAGPARAQTVVNFRDADIRAFLADAASVTGRPFVVDGRVQGKVTVVSERPLSRSEYIELVLSTLRANGLVAVPLGNGGFRVQPAEGAAAQASRIGSRGVSGNLLVTEVLRLRNADAAGIIETLRPLVSQQGSLTANAGANSIVIADFADNVRRVRQLVAQLDRQDLVTRQVALTNAGAREVAASLQALGEGGGGRAGVQVVPFDASNSIALRGPAEEVARFAALAEDFDRQSASGAEIRVYWLEHADAAGLLPTLQQLIGGGTGDPAAAVAAQAQAQPSPREGAAAGPVAAPAPILSTGGAGGQGIAGRGPAIITRYEGANAIIVAARPELQRQLGELIRQLDARREQVLVEAIIVEIGDDAAKRLGVQFLLGGTPGSGVPFAATNYSNAVPSILTIGGAVAAERLGRTTTTTNGTTTTTTTTSPLGSALQEAAAASLLSATGGFAGAALELGRNAIFGTIINAVRSDTSSNILSTPHIITLDNRPAKMLVGQEVPIVTGEALSDNFDNAFRTVQRQEVGIKLEVTPQINSSGEVKLMIRQEVSSVAGPVSPRSADLVINKRQFETTLTVDDGDILAIGGLLDDNERRTLEKIPVLGDLPVVGALFRSKSRARQKTNLMVFIRPTILRSRQDAADVTRRRYGWVREAQLARDPAAEPSIDALVLDYLGATPPVPTLPRADDVTLVPARPPVPEAGAPPAPPAPLPPPAGVPISMAPPPPAGYR